MNVRLSPSTESQPAGKKTQLERLGAKIVYDRGYNFADINVGSETYRLPLLDNMKINWTAIPSEERVKLAMAHLKLTGHPVSRGIRGLYISLSPEQRVIVSSESSDVSHLTTNRVDRGTYLKLHSFNDKIRNADLEVRICAFMECLDIISKCNIESFLMLTIIDDVASHEKDESLRSWMQRLLNADFAKQLLAINLPSQKKQVKPVDTKQVKQVVTTSGISSSRSMPVGKKEIQLSPVEPELMNFAKAMESYPELKSKIIDRHHNPILLLLPDLNLGLPIYEKNGTKFIKKEPLLVLNAYMKLFIQDNSLDAKTSHALDILRNFNLDDPVSVACWWLVREFRAIPISNRFEVGNNERKNLRAIDSLLDRQSIFFPDGYDTIKSEYFM